MFLIDVLVQLKKQKVKAMCIVLFDVFNGCSSSIKEINRLTFSNHLKISKTKLFHVEREG